jgi:hypothetical protein
MFRVKTMKLFFGLSVRGFLIAGSILALADDGSSQTRESGCGV